MMAAAVVVVLVGFFCNFFFSVGFAIQIFKPTITMVTPSRMTKNVFNITLKTVGNNNIVSTQMNHGKGGKRRSRHYRWGRVKNDNSILCEKNGKIKMHNHPT